MAVLHCPHCKHAQHPLAGVDTQHDKVKGAYPDRPSAAAKAIPEHHVSAYRCTACAREYWLAFVDQRW